MVEDKVNLSFIISKLNDFKLITKKFGTIKKQHKVSCVVMNKIVQ